ncbi:MAG: response regulator, partial [Cyclobacteriaceae bacterium]
VSDPVPLGESPVEEEEVKRKTILVVDDNAELRNFIKGELQKNFQVDVAKNGSEGLSIAQKLLPDLIVTDVMMPEMDGYEFCEKVKSDLKTSHIPLIMLTAKSSSEDHFMAIDKGADVYLPKPFDISLLKVQIKQLLKSRQIMFEKYLKGVSDLENINDATAVDRDFMHTILDYIREHMSDPTLSVESVAENVSLSRSQLYRKVKALTGSNVNEFIRRIRLEQARKLINQGHSNVNEVSHKVGFSSASYFTKCYKQHFGILPTDEKKSEQPQEGSL